MLLQMLLLFINFLVYLILFPKLFQLKIVLNIFIQLLGKADSFVFVDSTPILLIVESGINCFLINHNIIS